MGSEKNTCARCKTVVKTRELYLISYKANNGSGAPSSQIKSQGVAITLATATPTRTNYTFLGWATSATATTATYKAGASYTGNKNLTLYAVWQSNYCTVKFNLNGGSGTAPATITAKRGSSVTVPKANGVSKTGYYFLGWRDNVTGQTYRSGDSIVLNTDKNLLAIWQVRYYPLKFDKRDGIGTAPSDRSVAYGASTTIGSSSLSKKGYYFLGWAISKENADKKIVSYTSTSKITITNATILYAVWSEKTITVSFNLNKGKGTLPTTIKGKYGSTATIGKSSVTRAGYYFLGWSTDPDKKVKDDSDFVTGSQFTLEDDLKLYAIWSPMKWNVTFNANQGTGKLPKDFTVETDVWHAIGNANLTRTDYYFLGWSTSKTATTAMYTSKDSIRITEDTGLNDVTLYAVWKHENCTLTFDLNGGASGAPEKITVEYGSTVTIPKSPSIKHNGKNVYFLGWSTTRTDMLTATNYDVNYISKADETHRNTIKLKKNTTLYAVWRHFHSFDGVHYDEKTGDHQEYCVYCKKWITTSHSIKTYALYENDENTGVGYHVKRCVNEQGKLCGYYELTEYCVKHVKKWTYYHGIIEDQNNELEDIYVRIGTCSQCGAKVTELYLEKQGSRIRPAIGAFGLATAGVILLAFPEPTWSKVAGGVLAVVSFVIEGKSLYDSVKQYEFQKDLDPDKMSLEQITPDQKRIKDFGDSAEDSSLIYIYDLRSVPKSNRATFQYAVTPAY